MGSSPVKIFLFSCIGAVCLCHAVDNADKTDPSYPLTRLNAYLTDQHVFERKVRALDKLYTAIALVKLEEARSLKERGEQENAKTLAAEAGAHWAEVQEAYELGLAHFDDSVLLHTFYGELLHDHLGQQDKAIEHWEKAVNLDKACARAQNNLGMYYLHIGRYEDGLACMDKALEAEPDNPDWLFNMVQVYLTNFTQVMKIRGWDRIKVYEEAMRMSERTVALSPSDYELLYDNALNHFLADRFGATPDWGRAVRAWQETLKRARKPTQRLECLLNEARVLLRAGDSERARACLEQAQGLAPDSPVVRQLLHDLNP